MLEAILGYREQLALGAGCHLCEDWCRAREHNAVQNWTVLCKIALNLLGRDNPQISLKAKRKNAAWDNGYMAYLLQTNLMS